MLMLLLLLQETRQVWGTAQSLGLIAGGTGVTPVLQALRAAQQLQQVSVLCSSTTPEEAQTAHELIHGVHKSARVAHTITGDCVPNGWTDFTRQLDASMLKDTMPPPGPLTCVLVSGPVGLMGAVRGALFGLGYTANMICELEA
jgi:cytochrome-b5 reductase